MHAVIKVIPGVSWGAQVQYHEGESVDTDNTDALEAWLRKQIKVIIPFQESRGGGIFLLVIPEDRVP